MAETSRSQVTITLGRTGQVIKKPGPLLDSAYSHQGGTKRSIRDRLGTSIEDSYQLTNKRLQLDDSRLNYPTSADYIDENKETRLARDDLRFKIMQSNVLKKSQSNGDQSGVDLREILSRSARPTTGMPQPLPEPRQRFMEPENPRQRFPEPENPRQRFPEPENPRQRFPETENLRQRFPETENLRQRFPETENMRQRFSEAENPRQRFPEAENVRWRFPEADNPRRRFAEADITRQRMEAPGRGLPPKRISESHPHLVDSRSSSYSPWTLDSLRQGSSELQRRPSVRAYGDVPLVRKDVIKVSRPIDASPSMRKSPSAVPISQGRAVIHKSPYMVDVRYTVEGFLHSLGLDKYSILFKSEEVDMTALRQMREIDLKELGVPMGPRKKILLALASRAKRQV